MEPYTERGNELKWDQLLVEVWLNLYKAIRMEKAHYNRFDFHLLPWTTNKAYLEVLLFRNAKYRPTFKNEKNTVIWYFVHIGQTYVGYP